MKVFCQRVQDAKVLVDDLEVGSCLQGLLLLVSFTESDDESLLPIMAKKVANLRIFEDEEGKMNKSILDIGGSILSISQFTLYANPYTGNRPSFTTCMKPDLAKSLYLKFNAILRNEWNIDVGEGIFGADMQIYPHLDGPVSIELEFLNEKKTNLS